MIKKILYYALIFSFIISMIPFYSAPVQATAYYNLGGTVTTSGDYTIHTFTTVGTSYFFASMTGNVEVLVVAGGGGGGTLNGGGGAGGIQYSASLAVTAGSNAVIIGDGGAGDATATGTGVNGDNSTFSSLTAIGGGGGGSRSSTTPYPGTAGANGGCGGGSSSSNDSVQYNGGTGSQGYNGGNGSVNKYGGGGGGGMGAVGGTTTTDSGANGGDGVNTYSDLLISANAGVDITGIHWIAGGGGGGMYNAVSGTAGSGGKGGGGAGSKTTNGTAGTSNTGGGGGGSDVSDIGGKGGSGIIIIKCLTSDFTSTFYSNSGGTLSLDISNPNCMIHTFVLADNNTNFVSTKAGNVEILVVAGGGGGGGHGTYNGGGGGGAGGALYDATKAIAVGSVNVIIGGGGAARTNGDNSTFAASTPIVAIGGGHGGGLVSAIDDPGANGGSGGGGSAKNTAGSIAGGTGSQGYNGGVGIYNATCPPGGGGGGQGAVGVAGSVQVAGNGGAGVTYTISGASANYAGGGGGGRWNHTGTNGTGWGSVGGSGTDATGGSGVANTGSGGGAGDTPGSGGSGTVIIRCVISDYIITVPTVTTQAASSITDTTATGNGNVTHDGDTTITERGIAVCLESHGTPDTGDALNIHDHTNAEGAFTESIVGMSAGTAYHFRAYAINFIGTSYGATVDVLTKPGKTVGVTTSTNSATEILVSWTATTGADNYHVYRGVTDLGHQGDVNHIHDTNAAAPLITKGDAVASDGTDAAHVDLSLSGTSVANGANTSYTVMPQNATGDGTVSDASANGYRLATGLGYQWNRSAADSDASYSTIGGFTSSTGEDTGAPSNGDGRYYTCTLTSTGASNTPIDSGADRGYREEIIVSMTSTGYKIVIAGRVPNNNIYTIPLDGITVTNTSAAAINVDISGSDAIGTVSWDLLNSYPTVMSDAFTNNSFDTSKFTESTNAGSLVAEQNSRLEMTSAAAVSAFVRSTNTYQLAETETIIKISNHSTDGGFKFCPTSVASHEWDVYSEANWYNFQTVAGGAVSATKKEGGAASTLATSGALTTPYWLRMRVTGGVIYFEYANNTATKPADYEWTELTHETWELSVALTAPEYIYLTSYNTPTTGALYITNFEHNSLSSVGTDIYNIKAGLEGDAYDVAVGTTVTPLIHNLAADATQKFGFKLYAPSTVTDDSVKKVSITLTVSAH